jgi:hypothetical protein
MEKKTKVKTFKFEKVLLCVTKPSFTTMNIHVAYEHYDLLNIYKTQKNATNLNRCSPTFKKEKNQ